MGTLDVVAGVTLAVCLGILAAYTTDENIHAIAVFIRNSFQNLYFWGAEKVEEYKPETPVEVRVAQQYEKVQAFHLGGTFGQVSHMQQEALFEPNPNPSRRLVAVGDLHGDLKQGMSVLRMLGLLDEEGTWTAKNTDLVQVGDIADRQPETLSLLTWFQVMKVQAIHKALNSQVYTLLGNHELMLLHLDFRFLSHDELDAIFKVFNTTAEVEPKLLPGYRTFQPNPPKYTHWPMGYRGDNIGDKMAVWQYMLQHGQWMGDALRSRHTATILGAGKCKTLFVHAALLPDMLDFMLDDGPPAFLSGSLPETLSVADAQTVVHALNEAVWAILAKCDHHGCEQERFYDSKARGGKLLGTDGPFWSRATYLQDEADVCPKVEAMVKLLGVEQIVSGHNPQIKLKSQWRDPLRVGRVNPRCGGRLYFIDVALSRAYGGFTGAWQCVNGQVSAIYPDMTETMPDMVANVTHVPSAEDATTSSGDAGGAPEAAGGGEASASSAANNAAAGADGKSDDKGSTDGGQSNTGEDSGEKVEL